MAGHNGHRGEKPMSTIQPFPDGYHSVQAYLIVKNCPAAIEFYKKAFGVTERMRTTRPDGTIGHAEIQFGGSCIMMADENAEINAFSPQHYGGSPVSIMVYVENCDAMYRQTIAAGGKNLREPRDESYGDRMAGVLDPFGFTWWIATHIKDLAKKSSETHAEEHSL
jgi:PhnB protein